ncbi:MAG: phosphoenolpyruvate carboxykinase (GTP) [Gammaproteobacteria bacterium]
MTTNNTALSRWVDDVAQLTKPKSIRWCDGSETEYQQLLKQMVETGDLLPLNPKTYPRCYLHRSNPSDVARVEHLTFVCTDKKEVVGPNNNWMLPADAHSKIDGLFAGAMQGRTMYVIPYCMGPIDSPYARCGVEITDSPYVVANMRLMTRMGTPALRRIEKDNKFVRGLHSTGDLNPDRRFIMHFPEELLIKSFGSGYGGNALLGKKCHALRIASWQARQEGWLAEHMLLVELESPTGEKHNLAAAFPSACGKTNLAMLIPPASLPGWKVRTLGDDIAWLHLDKQGQMRAINPEAGYFGVVPGTSPKTNKNAYDMIQSDTIFTNVALTADNEPWWEGKGTGTPVTDWQGRPYDPKNGPAAHPNSRFTVAAQRNASYSPLAEDPNGVPITAIIFGGRRRELAPLIYQARSWQHGVLVGASVASETTAAATGKVGVIRRDPMAMKPFCGYNFGDYWQHWLSFAERSRTLPEIFHVNWFRQNKDGKFLWPGFGDNLRVLQWIIDRCAGRVGARETAIGFLLNQSDLNVKGLIWHPARLSPRLVEASGWLTEMAEVNDYLQSRWQSLAAGAAREHQRIVSALN